MISCWHSIIPTANVRPSYADPVRRLHRWLIFAAAVLLLIVGGLASLAVTTVRSSFPQLDGQLRLEGLSASVEVLRDPHGIPQIYADNAEDLFAAEGYVHASDRFYEMDVRRHITAGRLSELFGPSQVSTDAHIRTLGWRRVAEQEIALLSPSTRRYLDAYASGVNAYLHAHETDDLSLEYAVLGLTGLSYHPEDWTPADSVSWLKAMAWDLSGNRTQELELAEMTDRVGAARAAELFPPFSVTGFAPIVRSGSLRDNRFDPAAASGSGRPAPLTGRYPAGARAAVAAAARIDAAIPPLVAQGRAEAGAGSNSWVVSGAHTASGKPLLGNDPHLATSIPSIFEQVGLHCRTVSAACPFDVSGYSFSGMPGVIIGHNARIAWGLTTSYLDVQDLYLEQVRGNLVRVGGRWEPLTVRTELIRVQGEDKPREITVRSSRHGPLISDVDAPLADLGRRASVGGYAVALQWTALTPSASFDAVLALDRAQNFAQFRASAAMLKDPSQNLVYADVDGNIGYQLPGRLPVRGRGDGLHPNPGWDPAYDWRGYVPFASLPYSYNPSSGLIVAANQPIIGAQYGTHLGSSYSYGWRSQELYDRLQHATGLTPATAEPLFYDTTVRFAAQLVPALLRVSVPDPWVAEGQHTLVGWDYTSPPGSAAAAYFQVVFRDLLALTFHDEMPRDLWPAGGDRWFAVVGQLLNRPSDTWWDDVSTPQVETRDDILRAAMVQARKDLTAEISRDTSGWSWGKLHRVTLRNTTLGESGVGLIERLFNRGDYPVGGGPAVVDAMSFDVNSGFGVTDGPTMRMLVDLSDLDASRWINQSGVSGHAFAATYDDQTKLWATNQTVPFLFSRSRVGAAATHRLTLAPSG